MGKLLIGKYMDTGLDALHSHLGIVTHACDLVLEDGLWSMVRTG